MTRLLQHAGFVRYFKNTSWLVAERLFRIFAGIAVGIWVARYLGPVRFGRFSFAQSFVSLFATLATLGITSVLVRDLINEEDRAEELLGTSFILIVVASLLTVGTVIATLRLTKYDASTEQLVYVISLATLFQSFSVVDCYFQSKVLSRYVVSASLITMFLSSIVKVALVLARADLILFAWAIVFDAVVLAISYLYFLGKHSAVVFSALRISAVVGKRLLRDSWPFVLSGALVGLYMKIDQVMLKEMLGDYAVGQYAAAIQLSEAWYFVPVVIVSSLFPAIVNAKKRDASAYENRLRKLYALMIVAGIAVSLPSAFLARPLVTILYGPEYRDAGSILSVHIWACVFVFLGVAGGKWLLVENLQVYSFMNTFLGAFSNIVLNLVLIPKFGAVGAAWATLISQAFAAYFGMFVWKRTRANFYRLTNAVFVIPKLNKADL